jgi:hypothetical protein
MRAPEGHGLKLGRTVEGKAARAGRLVLLGLAAMFAVATPAAAQELLQNRSFESPVAPLNGNNFYATMPNWTVTPGTVQPQPVNIVKAWSGYAGNPTVTPTGGGAQYFDVNATNGTVRQTVTLAAAGMVDFSAWFSVRDNQQALSGLTVNIRDSSNTVVATASTSFALADPIGLWKQASASNVPLPAGTYVFELVMPNESNADLASMVYKPPLSIVKTSAPYSDPSNGTTNPKLIPGAIAEYSFLVTSPAAYAVSLNTIIVADATPANMDLVVANIGGAGSGPAALVQGLPSSTLVYTFTSLASTTDDIEFSNNGGTSWTYTPVANSNGVDPAVTNVRLRPKGIMVAGSSFTFRLRYRVR